MIDDLMIVTNVRNARNPIFLTRGMTLDDRFFDDSCKCMMIVT